MEVRAYHHHPHIIAICISIIGYGGHVALEQPTYTCLYVYAGAVEAVA